MMEPLMDLSIFLYKNGLATTGVEARRLIAGGAVSINNKVVDSSLIREEDLEHALIKVGKHKMIQL